MKMTKSGIIKGAIVAIVAAIASPVILFMLWPYIYLHTENRNFENLRKKAELNCQTMPLHCAVRDGDAEGINQYIEGGGNLEIKDNLGQSALFWAIRNSKDPMVEVLLRGGLDPNTKDETGTSILYQTIAWQKYDVADELLESGADIDGLNGVRYPETILHWCVMNNRTECVKYLLDHGANIYLEDSFGYTIFERLQLHDHINEEIGVLFEK